MKRVNVLLVYIILFLQGSAQPLKAPSVYDSLNDLLSYFQKNTNNTAFIDALKNAAVYCNKNSNIDYLTSGLIKSEDILINMLNDSEVINRSPYTMEKLLAFGKTTLNLSTFVLPKKESLLYAAALYNLGMLYKTPDFLRAGELFEQALAIRKKISGEGDTDYIKTLISLASMYDAKGKREEAYSMIMQALATTAQTKGKENNLYADELFYLAEFYNESKKTDTAILLYEQELSLRRKILGGTNAGLALHMCSTALRYSSLGKYTNALTLYQEAATITKQTLGEGNFQYAWCLNCIGSMYYGMAEYEKSIPYTEQSLEIERKLCAEGHCSGDIPVNLHNLATTYQRMGKYEQALSLFQQAVSIEKANQKNNNGIAFDMPYLASLYEMMGKYNEALNLIKQTASDFEQKNWYGIDYIRTLNYLGSYYTNRKQYQPAIRAFKKALYYAKKSFGAQDLEYATTLNNMALTYKGLIRYDTAALLISQAAAIRGSLLGDEHPYYAASLNDLGELYMLMGKYDSAKVLYTQSLNIRKKVFGDEHPDYIASLTGLAALDITRNNINDADSLLIESNKLVLKQIDRVYTSLTEEEKIGYTMNQYYQFCYLPSLLFTNRTMKPEIIQQVYTNELALKGMVLNDQQTVLNSIRKSNDKNALELYNEWRSNKIKIGNQLMQEMQERSYKLKDIHSKEQSVQTIQQHSNDLDSIIGATNQMERELSHMSAAFRQQQERLTSKNISERLKPDEAAVEYMKFQYYNKKLTDSVLYAALIILAGDSIPKFVPLFEEKQLLNLLNNEGKNENSINRFYALNPNNDKQFIYSGAGIYSLIWKPVEKYLKGINIVYYAPSGSLSRIAFNALPVDAKGDLLIDRYRLHQLLSTRSVEIPLTVAQKPSAINIWADIQYDDKKINAPDHTYAFAQRNMNEGNAEDHTRDMFGKQEKKWPALNGSRLEMNNIEKIFKEAGINVSTITNTAATEEAFKAMDGKSPPVLHIATHGFFWTMKNKPDNIFAMQQDPMFRSGLVLAGANNIWDNKPTFRDKEDGVLTSYEIAQLDLSNTDLVVLSACETALGDIEGNEGVIGLQRAFKLAGVKRMIISLWRIPDNQTVELMSLFYRNYLEGQMPCEALRSAQLTMKKKYPIYDWAGFVLVE
jgi:CHAT domain-containing protein